jgi:hypothetical protein
MSGEGRAAIMANLGDRRTMIQREFAGGVDRVSTKGKENVGEEDGGLSPSKRPGGTAGHAPIVLEPELADRLLPVVVQAALSRRAERARQSTFLSRFYPRARAREGT